MKGKDGKEEEEGGTTLKGKRGESGKTEKMGSMTKKCSPHTPHE